jgi:hypothetical protein
METSSGGVSDSGYLTAFGASQSGDTITVDALWYLL